MKQFDVNVRAIVMVTRAEQDATGVIDRWDEYDFETLERDVDGQVLEAQIRCDQTVTVEADSVEDAIENAKSAASDIYVDGYTIDDVTLWVDEGIDVQLTHPEDDAQESSVPTV